MSFIRYGILLAAAWLLTALGPSISNEENSLVYFRYDGGVAGPETGPLPGQLDSPQVAVFRVEAMETGSDSL